MRFVVLALACVLIATGDSDADRHRNRRDRRKGTRPARFSGSGRRRCRRGPPRWPDLFLQLWTGGPCPTAAGHVQLAVQSRVRPQSSGRHPPGACGQARRVALDDPVGKYIVELQQGSYTRGVTLRQLATHTSGLLLPSDHPPWPQHRYDLAELISILNHWAPNGGKPGKQHIYSHAGFVLLGLALERRIRDAHCAADRRARARAAPNDFDTDAGAGAGRPCIGGLCIDHGPRGAGLF